MPSGRFRALRCDPCVTLVRGAVPRATTLASLPASVAAFHLAWGPDAALYVTGPTLSPYDVLYRVTSDGTVTTRYTYEGEADKDGKKLDRITSKVLAVDLTLEDSPLPLTIKSTDLKPSESKGEMWYDRKLGRIIAATSSVRIVGDITFTINNMDLPSKLDLKMATTSQPKE